MAVKACKARQNSEDLPTLQADYFEFSLHGLPAW
jgi:hypothetical protein